MAALGMASLQASRHACTNPYGDAMPTDAPETLTDLVMATLAPQGRDTIDTLYERCTDPATGYHPARTTVWKLASPDRAETVKINPRIVGAVAAGLGISPTRVRAAAAYQFTGYHVASNVAGATVIHEPGSNPEGSKTREVLDSWEREDQR